MNEYLIFYGGDNDMVTFEGDSPEKALSEFEEWVDEGVSANRIMLLVAVPSSLDDE